MAKPKTSQSADRRAVAELARAVKRQRLTREQFALLRQLTADVEQVEDSKGLKRTVRYNLQVVDTQIRDVLAHSDGDAFDERAVANMPEHMQRRIIERLDNVAARLSKLSASEPATYTTSTFKCMRDFETCRAQTTGPAYWCSIALLVCLARELLAKSS